MCAPRRASVSIPVSQAAGTCESASVLASHNSPGGPAPASAALAPARRAAPALAAVMATVWTSREAAAITAVRSWQPSRTTTVRTATAASL